jgi:hypothetical protein
VVPTKPNNDHASLLSPEASAIYHLVEEFELNLLEKLGVFGNSNPETAESKAIEQFLKQKLNRLFSDSHFSMPSMRRRKNSLQGFVSDKHETAVKMVRFDFANCTHTINQSNLAKFKNPLVIKQLKSEYDALSPEAKKILDPPDGMSKKHRLADDIVPSQKNKGRRSQSNKDMRRVITNVFGSFSCRMFIW